MVGALVPRRKRIFASGNSLKLEVVLAQRGVQHGVGASRADALLTSNQQRGKLPRQREIEPSTAVDSGFGPNLATVAVDDALDRG